MSAVGTFCLQMLYVTGDCDLSILFLFDLEIKLWKLENLTNDSQISGLNESENDYRSNPLGFRNGDVKFDHPPDIFETVVG